MTECQEGFQIVEKNDGTTICLSSTSQLFYFDNDLSKYKLCSEHGSFSNCEKCQTTEDNNFECLNCETNYAFAHGNTEPAPCELIESLLEEYYPEDENNYYSCQSTAYHQVENCEKCFTKDKCHQCKDSFTKAFSETKCISLTLIEQKNYYNNPIGSDKYYLCSESSSINNCLKCESSTECIECQSGYEIEEHDKCIPQSDIDAKLYYKDDTTNNKYFSCTKISNCEKCASSTECLSCKTGFYLVEGDDNAITCKNIDISNYYQKTIDSKSYYRKCEKDIENCNKCTDSTHCTECEQNFVIIDDDYSECKSLSEQKYYYDNELGKYKLCSYKLSNCEKCITKNNEFICKECSSEYALKHDENFACAVKSSLEGNENFYTNDSGINYYLCSLYNDVSHCIKCSNKDTCIECEDPYEMFNINKLCALQSEIEANLYVARYFSILFFFY